jgi:predicted GNAT family N-acyltransferase
MTTLASRVAQKRIMADAFTDALHKQFPTLDFYVSVRSDSLSLDRVIVPKTERGTGIGTKFMEALCREADRRKLKITLSPSTDFGGSSVNRLKSFYKRFGFVENKGRHKDFAISDSMYRLPK